MRRFWAFLWLSTALGAGPRQSLIRHEVLAEGAAVAHQELLESPSACRDCCNDGKAYVPCLDVEACAAAAPPTGRYALIFSYVGKFAPKLLQYLDSAKAAALSANKADLLLLMTVSDAASMTTALRADLEKEGGELVWPEGLHPAPCSRTGRV